MPMGSAGSSNNDYVSACSNIEKPVPKTRQKPVTKSFDRRASL